MQIPLIPISPHEFQESAYRMAILMQERDDAIENFTEVRKQHKEHMGAIDREIRECRLTIRRAQLEREEGLMGQQIDALMNHAQEREDTR